MSQVIWQQNYEHKWRIHNPFPLPHGHDTEIKISGAVGVIKDGNDYFLFAQLNGTQKQWKLTAASFEIPVSPFLLKVTISNLNIGTDISFVIEADGYVNIPHVPCVKLFAIPVHIHRLVKDDLDKLMSLNVGLLDDGEYYLSC